MVIFKKRCSVTSAVLSAVFFFGISVSSRAADKGAHNGWLKAQAGLDRADKTSFTAFGGGAGVKLGGHFGLGAYYLMSNTKKDGSIEAKHALMGGELMFFPSVTDFFNIGLKSGISKADGSVVIFGKTVAASSSDFYLGPTIGIEIPLGPLALGVEGAYLRVFADTAYGVILGLGTLKIYF